MLTQDELFSVPRWNPEWQQYYYMLRAKKEKDQLTKHEIRELRHMAFALSNYRPNND